MYLECHHFHLHLIHSSNFMYQQHIMKSNQLFFGYVLAGIKLHWFNGLPKYCERFATIFKGPVSGLRQFLAIEIPPNMMKNVLYFM